MLWGLRNGDWPRVRRLWHGSYMLPKKNLFGVRQQLRLHLTILGIRADHAHLRESATMAG